MKNFIDDYLDYCSHAEPPEKFQLWSGLSIISHLIGRQVWMDCSIFVARPQMYIALVGDPGIKKSTAMLMAKSIIEAVEPSLEIAPDSITKEAIVQLMGVQDSTCKRFFEHAGKRHEYRQLSICADEFVNLINAGGNAPGMIEFLTAVWTTELYKDHTKNKGKHDVPKPYVPILGCLTTETVKKLMTEKVISTGMSRRILFIVADRNGPPRSRPSVSPEQQAAKERAISHASAVRSVVGEYHWAEESIVVWDIWYNENYMRMEDKQGDSALLNFLQTKPLYVIKVAMLLALCDYDNFRVLILQPWHLNRAIQLVTEEETGASRLFAGAGRNELASITHDIKHAIEASKEPTPRIQIVSKFNKDATPDEVGRILSFLTSTGAIHEWTATYGTKTVNMVGTPAQFSAWKEKEKKRLLKDLPPGSLPSTAGLV